MKVAELLIIDESAGYAGNWEWFLFDPITHRVFENSQESCSGLAWEDALTHAEQLGYQVISSRVLHGDGMGNVEWKYYTLEKGQKRQFEEVRNG